MAAISVVESRTLMDCGQSPCFPSSCSTLHTGTQSLVRAYCSTLSSRVRTGLICSLSSQAFASLTLCCAQCMRVEPRYSILLDMRPGESFASCPPYYLAILVIVCGLLIIDHTGWRMPEELSLARVTWFNMAKQVLFADRRPEFLNPSFWTLAVEWRWYFIFPLVLCALDTVDACIHFCRSLLRHRRCSHSGRRLRLANSSRIHVGHRCGGVRVATAAGWSSRGAHVHSGHMSRVVFGTVLRSWIFSPAAARLAACCILLCASGR